MDLRLHGISVATIRRLIVGLWTVYERNMPRIWKVPCGGGRLQVGCFDATLQKHVNATLE